MAAVRRAAPAFVPNGSVWAGFHAIETQNRRRAVFFTCRLVQMVIGKTLRRGVYEARSA